MSETQETPVVKIKGKRGGPRPGSGRKPNYLKRLGIKAITAAEILAHHDEPKLWYALLHHKSPDIRLRTLSYLTDRRDGKPKQAVDISGGIVHAHTVYRNPQLAALSLDELQALDGITKKLALPAPDDPHNQTQSDAAANAMIEAVWSAANKLGPNGGNVVAYLNTDSERRNFLQYFGGWSSTEDGTKRVMS